MHIIIHNSNLVLYYIFINLVEYSLGTLSISPSLLHFIPLYAK